jgi:hypothetical protein
MDFLQMLTGKEAQLREFGRTSRYFQAEMRSALDGGGLLHSYCHSDQGKKKLLHYFKVH